MARRPLEIIEQPPIACTLDAEGRVERVDDWQQLADASLVKRVRIENGIKLHFQKSAEEAVRDLASLEKQCCAFFNFDFHHEGDAFVLTVTAAPEAEPVLLGLFDLLEAL